jgi:hypothetical protein
MNGVLLGLGAAPRFLATGETTAGHYSLFHVIIPPEPLGPLPHMRWDADEIWSRAKHARARNAHIAAVVDGGLLRLVVRDDGVGGARYDGSSGLLGLGDRAAAVKGGLHIVSPAGGGTVVTAALPIPAAAVEGR